MDKLMTGLEIMGKGMLGIFVVIAIIMVLVMLMNKLGSGKEEKKED